MKIKLLIMMMSVLMLNSVADAYLINYTVSGGNPGSNSWTGTFDVNLLTVAAKDYTNINSISAPGLQSFTPTGFYGSATMMQYNNIDYTRYFLPTSLGLSKAIYTDSLTWNDLIGQSYTGDFDNTSNGITLGAHNAQITFSAGVGPVATPEPGTMMLLGSGVFTFGLSRFRRRKQEVSA